MKTKFFSFITFLIILTVLTTSIVAESNTKSYIIHLKDPDTVSTVSKTISIQSTSQKSKAEVVKKSNDIKALQNDFLDSIKTQSTKTASVQSTKSNSIVSTDPFKLRRQFSTVKAVSADISEDYLAELKNNPYVESIVENPRVHISMVESLPIINAPLSQNILYNNTNITGAGQTVCIIDTGIYPDHPELNESIVDQKCYCFPDCCPDGTAEDNNATDDNGHGTHVAGTIVGKTLGVAPGAKVVAVKALDGDGSGYADDTLSAAEYCANITNVNTYNISVISMSLGISAFSGSCDDEPSGFMSAANQLVKNNVTIIAATGNDGHSDKVSAPACGSNVTAVGATYDSNIASIGWAGAGCFDYNTEIDDITCFTNIDPVSNKPELFAPGARITSAVPPTSFCNTSSPHTSCDNSTYKQMGGTSMATPHVSGVALLVHQMYRYVYNESANWTTATEALTKSDATVTAARAGGFSKPRVDAKMAVYSLEKTKPTVNYTANNPVNNTNTTNPVVTFQVNVSDEYNNISNCYLEWKGTSNLSMDIINNENNATCTYTFIVPEKNVFEYKVYAIDYAGNIGLSKNYYINITNVAPVITSASPNTTNVSFNERTNQTFKINFTEPNNDSVTAFWYLNNTFLFSEAVQNQSNYTLNVTQTIAGNNTLRVLLTDGAMDTSRTWNLEIIDVADPPTLLQNISDQWWYKQINSTSIKQNVTINLSGHFEDLDNTPLNYTLYTLDNVSLANLTHNITNNSLFITSSYNFTGEFNLTINVSDNQTTINTTFKVTILEDYDNDTYLIPELGGNDCNDENANLWTGKSCTRSCYSGAAYDSSCQCSGGTYTCSSGGSRSSGGGGSSLAISTSKTQDSFYLDKITSNEAITKKIRKHALPLSELTIQTNKDFQKITLEVKTIEAKEKKAIKLTIPNSYDLFEVEHEGIENEDFKTVTIQFRVNKTWLDDSNFVNVSLLRREESNHTLWIRYVGISVGSDDQYYFFNTTVPGLSYFAIIGELSAPKKIAEEEVEVNKTPEFVVFVNNTYNITPSSNLANDSIINMSTSEFVFNQTEEQIILTTERVIAAAAIIIVQFLLIFFFIFKTFHLFPHMKKLEKTVDKMVEKGEDEEQITKTLKKAGWKPRHINPTLKKVKKKHELNKLEAYIYKRLKRGDKDDKILSDILKKGWHKNHIAFYYKKVKEYIREEEE